MDVVCLTDQLLNMNKSPIKQCVLYWWHDRTFKEKLMQACFDLSLPLPHSSFQESQNKQVQVTATITLR